MLPAARLLAGGRVRGLAGLSWTRPSHAHSGRAAALPAGAPQDGDATAGGAPPEKLRQQFQLAADYERSKGYNNCKGKKFDTFGAFLVDVLERSEAQAAKGRRTISWQPALASAKRYADLLVPDRAKLLEDCGKLLGAPHDSPVPLRAVASLQPAAALAAAVPQPVPPLRAPQLKSSTPAPPAAKPAAPRVAAAANKPPAPPKPPPARPRQPRVPLVRSAAPGAAPPAEPLVPPSPLLIAFDLETTGLQSSIDRVIEIAVVECGAGDAFSTLVNPGRGRVSAQITALTGIDAGMVSESHVPGFALAAERLEAKVTEWAAQRGEPPILLAAHNARRFDVQFLVAEYERAGRPLPPAWRFVDTLPLAQDVVRKLKSYKLSSLIEHFGLPKFNAHRAEADAHALRALLGPSALGSVVEDLHDRLARAAFSAQVAVPPGASGVATPRADARTPAAPDASFALLEAADEDDLSEVPDDDEALDGDNSSAETAQPIYRRKKKSAEPKRVAVLRADPLQEQQGGTFGEPMTELALQQSGLWQPLPLADCLRADDAALLAPTFRSVEELLRHYPARFDEFQLYHGGLHDGAHCMARGVLRRVAADVDGPDWTQVMLTLTLPGDGTCSAVLARPLGLPADSARAFLESLAPERTVAVYGRLNGGVLNAAASPDAVQFTDVKQCEAAPTQQADTTAVVPLFRAFADEHGGVLPAARWERILTSALAHLEQAEARRGDWLACALGASHLERLSLISGAKALRAFHQPSTRAAVLQARQRLAFEELFLLQLVQVQRRAALLNSLRAPSCTSTEGVHSLVATLQHRDWKLTATQRRALDDVLADMAQVTPMLRLLTGDAGFGKSTVAYLALLAAHDSGQKSVLTVPSAALASQHFARLNRLLKDADLAPARRPRVVLLPAAADVEAAAHIVIGSHEQTGVTAAPSRALGLVVVDDEPDFGALQQAVLRACNAAAAPHVLALSSMPLSRPEALAVHGSSTLSVLDTPPPKHRAPVMTEALPHAERAAAYEAARSAAARGARALIVCPRAPSASAAALLHSQLCAPGGVLHGLAVGVLDDTMTAADRAAAISKLATGATSVLVASNQAELAVEVAGLELIIVEQAAAFRLAELHQLRSRIVSGARTARLLLLYESAGSPQASTQAAAGSAAARMAVIAQRTDGLGIALEELRLGAPPSPHLDAVRATLSVASLAEDADLLDEARKAAAGALLDTNGEAERAAALLYALHGSRTAALALEAST